MRKIKKNEGDMRKKIMSMIWKSDPWLIVSGVLRSLVQIILPYITIVFSAEVINALANGKLLQKSAENRGLDERQCSGGKMRRGLFGER